MSRRTVDVCRSTCHQSISSSQPSILFRTLIRQDHAPSPYMKTWQINLRLYKTTITHITGISHPPNDALASCNPITLLTLQTRRMYFVIRVADPTKPRGFLNEFVYNFFEAPWYSYNLCLNPWVIRVDNLFDFAFRPDGEGANRWPGHTPAIAHRYCWRKVERNFNRSSENFNVLTSNKLLELKQKQVLTLWFENSSMACKHLPSILYGINYQF